jgi:hypothetical protein
MAVKRKRAAKKRAPGRGENRKGETLGALREKIASLVSSRAFEMVEYFAEDVEHNGNLSAMKFLFEMIGLFPAASESRVEEKERAWGETLLDRLGAPQNGTHAPGGEPADGGKKADSLECESSA